MSGHPGKHGEPDLGLMRLALFGVFLAFLLFLGIGIGVGYFLATFGWRLI